MVLCGVNNMVPSEEVLWRCIIQGLVSREQSGDCGTPPKRTAVLPPLCLVHFVSWRPGEGELHSSQFSLVSTHKGFFSSFNGLSSQGVWRFNRQVVSVSNFAWVGVGPALGPRGGEFWSWVMMWACLQSESLGEEMELRDVGLECRAGTQFLAVNINLETLELPCSSSKLFTGWICIFVCVSIEFVYGMNLYTHVYLYDFFS